MNKLVAELNQLQKTSITFEAAADPTSSIYTDCGESVNDIPYSLKRKAIDNLCKIERATEETTALNLRLRWLLSWITTDSFINYISQIAKIESLGVKAVIFEKLCETEVNLIKLSLGLAHKKIVGNSVEIDTTFCDSLPKRFESCNGLATMEIDYADDTEYDSDIGFNISDNADEEVFCSSDY